MQQLNFDAIFGTSAATGEGLTEALESLCRKILQKAEVNKKEGDAKPTQLAPLNKDKKGGCCWVHFIFCHNI